MDITQLNPLSLLLGQSYDVNDKVVLITGAAQGIGLELAKLLHSRGAAVAIVDLDGEAADKAANDLGDRAVAIAASVADRDAMEKAVLQTIEVFGGLDIVVANAGIVPKPATLRTMDGTAFDRVMDVNLTGVFNTIHPALDSIIAAQGHVVVVSSCAAFAPGMGGAPYMISKAAVEQLGRSLRVELAPHGASAGVAYFGIVETAMARGTLDEDELGHEIGGMLPWPLNIRISAEEAAKTIADGIGRRAARTIAPSGWEPYALFRGLINVFLDSQLTRDKRVHSLLKRVEERGGK
ncbi:SDR family oxidoreductase [Smaragdicoccus niigatensis]|uniref:SDR family oxidoreductase n=1 Tax=Smaragdicoccus niigatensis TaxID=359359 RepID=UPI000380676A|nr:SDR family oxidoreductase [Smaragdicoccus niigatensis]